MSRSAHRESGSGGSGSTRDSDVRPGDGERGLGLDMPRCLGREYEVGVGTTLGIDTDIIASGSHCGLLVLVGG